MPKVALYNMQGSQVGEIDLKDDVFGQEVNTAVLHQVVKAQLANRRQGTQSALTRAEVRGGGIKPWRQKGTGRARQGSIRSPQWRHGGVVFAPKPRSYRLDVNRKVRRLAMKSALSSKVRDSEIKVVDTITLAEGKTRLMAEVLKNLGITTKTLLVLPERDENIERAARNIPFVRTINVNTLSVLDVLDCDTFLLTQGAVKSIEEVYA